MDHALIRVLDTIAERHREDIADSGLDYKEVDIGEEARKLGLAHLAGKYGNVCAVIPLKRPVEGMKVLIDGRSFAGYARCGNGVVVPGYVARDTGLPCRSWDAAESMILNFN
jgi:hypothetical protein